MFLVNCSLTDAFGLSLIGDEFFCFYQLIVSVKNEEIISCVKRRVKAPFLLVRASQNPTSHRLPASSELQVLDGILKDVYHANHVFDSISTHMLLAHYILVDEFIIMYYELKYFSPPVAWNVIKCNLKVNYMIILN